MSDPSVKPVASNIAAPELSDPHPQETVRETFDSIVIAFILAFVFRAFIIEAFVIPTGSMAATLNGAHGTMICQNCGWEFEYGLNDLANSPRGIAPFDEQSLAVCQNCRYGNDTRETNDARRNQKSGDHILVFKWPFDLGGELLGPRRWDVVVFKTPSDGTTNFIKRLAGLPNEVLQIIDGDVYAVPADELSEECLSTLEQARHLKYLRRANGDSTEIAQLDQEVAETFGKALIELDKKMHIARKADLAQEVLWKVAYNHDYPPREVGEDQPRWYSPDDDGLWTIGNRKLSYNGVGQGEQRVELSARLNGFCSYNTLRRWVNQSQSYHHPVSDLRVRFVLDFKEKSGSVRVGLSKRDDLFVGEISSDGMVKILKSSRNNASEPTELCSTRIPGFDADRKIELQFQNVDYRVELNVDGKTILATNDNQYSPDLATLRQTLPPQTPPPYIEAADTNVELTHVVVEVDQYYISNSARLPLVTNWGTQNNPILLRNDEFFMLGDNTAQSKDSRLWNYEDVGPHLIGRGEDYQQGTVPRDQLIGRAFFVYWPSGLRTSLIPFLKDQGWIPNFGNMRWIR
jgi:signal peptidase I